jgi:hypothetical protein
MVALQNDMVALQQQLQQAGAEREQLTKQLKTSVQSGMALERSLAAESAARRSAEAQLAMAQEALATADARLRRASQGARPSQQ